MALGSCLWHQVVHMSTCGLYPMINGIEWIQCEFQDPTDGGTLVPYKAISCGDIP